MAKEIKGCEVSAYTLALGIIANNPELADKIADLAQYANQAALRHDAIIEGAMQGIEGESKALAHHYSLKEESANIKLSAAIFGGVLANTRQGDEALRLISEEIANTYGTVSDGLELYKMIQDMDLSNLTDIAKTFTNGDIEAAKKVVDDIHNKLSSYIGTEFSIVRSGSKVKVLERQTKLKSELDEVKKLVDEAEMTLGPTNLKKLKKDYEIIKNYRDEANTKYNWRTPEGKAEIRKIGTRYGLNTQSARTVEEKIKKLMDAKTVVDENKDTVIALQKEYDEALKGDIRLIEDGKNPVNAVVGDEEWRFNKGFNTNPSDRVMHYGQYVLSRTLLTGGKNVPQSVYDTIVETINSAGDGKLKNFLDEKLTEDWIMEEGRTLEELLARAYTNPLDLVSDGNLRTVYRQRLLELASDGVLSTKDADYIESLMDTVGFSKAGGGFSSVMKQTDLVRTANKLGIRVPGNNGVELWNSIINLFKREDFEGALLGDVIKLGNGMELSSRQLLELVSDMLKNININKLIASETLTDNDILKIAGNYLIGNEKKGASRLKSLFDMAKKAPSTDDVRGIVLKTITGRDIPEDKSVAFFDFRKGLKATEGTEARAKFQERLAQANTLEIPSNKIPDITDSLEREISKYRGGYILVNDSQWKMNERLVNALDTVNHGEKGERLPVEERVSVIAPSGGFMGTISSRGGKLIYRTSYSEGFNELVRKVAIRSMGQSSVDTKFTEELQKKLLRGDLEALKEYNDLLEKDAKNFFGEMLGVGEDAYKDKLPAMLEEATGISFKNYDKIVDKADFWRKVDDAFMLGMKTVGNYEQEFTTVADVMKMVDSLTPDELVSRLNSAYGFEFTTEQITKDGVIKQDIKDAYLNYQLSQTPLELLERKGKLLSVINGGTVDTIDVSQFKAMLQSNDFSEYKDLFFHNADISDEILNKYSKKINDMIFNGLCAQVAMNLVKAGYELPMTNIRDLIYDYLMDRLTVNGDFARAFLYKNGLPDTLETLKAVVNDAMPKELRFGYDNGYKYDVANHGGHIYHEKFSLDYSGTGEGGSAHGRGVYVTIEKPGRATMYAQKGRYRDPYFQETRYKGKNRDELATYESEHGWNSLGAEFTVAMDMLAAMKGSAGLKYEDALEVMKSEYENEIKYQLEDLKKNPNGSTRVLEVYRSYLDAINRLSKNDFEGGILAWEKAKEPPKFTGLSIKGQKLYQKYYKKGKPNRSLNNGIAYMIDDLSVKELEEDERGQWIKDEWYSFDEARDNAITNLNVNLSEKRALLKNKTLSKEAFREIEEETKDAIELLRKLKPDDFDFPAMGHYGYFYKLDVPDFVKEGAGTPNGASYLDEQTTLYDMEKKEFRDTRLIDAVAKKLKEDGYIHYEQELTNAIVSYRFVDQKHGQMFTEEELYDLVSNMIGGKKAASKFFSDMGYKGLNYVGAADGLCRVVYKDSDVDVLVIYDNKYKIPVYIKPGLDKNKYIKREVRAVSLFSKGGTGRGVVKQLVEKELKNGTYFDLTKTLEKEKQTVNSIVGDLLIYTKNRDEFKAMAQDLFDYLAANDLIKLSSGKRAVGVASEEEVFYRYFLTVLANKKERYERLVKSVGGEIKEIGFDELKNFNRPAMFQLKHQVDSPWGVAVADDLDIFFENALLIRDFKHNRTLKEIAKAHGIPVNMVETILTPWGVDALGRYGHGIIDLAKVSKTGTLPHEIFHGVFSMVDLKTYNKILDDGTNLFKLSRKDLEEMLADKFSEYLRTGKFTYGDEFKKYITKEGTRADKEGNAFIALIKSVFEKAKEWLGLVDKHSEEVQKLFDDILDLKYAKQPDSPIFDAYTRLVEVPNKFVEDTYSSLIAMSAVKNGDKLPGVGQEAERLKSILDNYHNALSEATMGGKTISFEEAQKYKAKAGYALDMFEQDYLYPRYKNLTTQQERNELYGLKYGLAIATNTEGLADIKKYNDMIMQRYRGATESIATRNEYITASLEGKSSSIQKEILKRQQQLMEQGATVKFVGGSPIVVDTREELYRQLRNIPNTVSGLENLKAMGRVGLDQLTNEEAYFLLNVVELSKNADNKANMIMQTIYKVNPQLARIDFFNTYKAVDGVPKMLEGNLLTSTKYLSDFDNTLTFDEEVKKSILKSIKDEFARNGTLVRVTPDKKKNPKGLIGLDKIVDDALVLHKEKLSNSIKGSEWKKFKENAALVYTEAFAPYTYLQDVPKVVKESIGNILAEQEKGIRQALELLGDSNKLTDIMDSITIYTNDGTIKTFRELLDGDVTDINKIIFNTDSAIIGEADVVSAATINPKASKKEKQAIEKQNRKVMTNIENNYREGLAAYLNKAEVVGEGERKLSNTILVATREIVKKYSLTNKFAEADNALASINEEIIRRFKSDILGLKGMLTKGGQILWGALDIGGRISGGVRDRWLLVQERYKTFYGMSLDQLVDMTVSGSVDTMALNMVKYFKEMEQRLGSLDGLKGCSTDIEINKAFAHIGEVVMNIDSMTGLYSLMSGIEGNQFLKFFRFSSSNQPSYVSKFVIGDEGKETLGGFRTYVDRTDEGLNKEWFNKTFGANLTDREYAKVIQALSGFTIINRRFKALESALNFMNTSNFLFRTLVSYPGQLVTIANQAIAYFLRQKGWEQELGIEDLGTIDAIRHDTGILNGTYNELNIGAALKRVFSKVSPDDVNPYAYYNRYGVPDVEDLMKNEKFYTSDDLATIYSKIDNYGATRTWGEKIDDLWVRFLRNADAYKDNANNIIDGLFARNFKNIAFVRALQSNQVMKFATAEQFAKFMSGGAPSAMKKRVMDAVTAESGRNFRNILGLGFSGLDRALGWGPITNLITGAFQILNFRGAWGMNIARQTNNIFMTALKIGTSGTSKEAKDAIATYLAKSPEFVNFTSQLFTDLKNAWKLVRYQDNGQIPPEEEEWSLLDFTSFALKNMEFASQRWQGIQSYGTARVGIERMKGAYRNLKDPEIYKDTLGVGAFFNALAKNAGRNWKAPNFIMKVIATKTSQGWPAAWEYLANERWKLSFGTLRYLMNEDQTDYGWSTEMPQKKVGIPFILTGEPYEEGDKAFSYDLAGVETFQNLASLYDATQKGDTEAAAKYRWNLIDTAFNSSQMLGILKSSGRALNGMFDGETISNIFNDLHMYEMGNPFSAAEAADIIGEGKAGGALLKYGYYIPDDADGAKTFIETIMGQSDYRPGNIGFNKSLFNFDKSGHMKNFDESNSKDDAMELMLNNMKYVRDENRRFVTDEKGERIVTNYWQQHMRDITSVAYDEDLMVKLNFDFINNWAEANNKDPNYMLYKRLIGEGVAGNYLDNEADKYRSQFDTVYGLKKDKKFSLKEMTQSILYDGFVTNLLGTTMLSGGENVPFLVGLATLDKQALMDADIKIVEDELSKKGDKETLQKFFEIDKKTGEVSLTSKYESFVREQARLSWYLQQGDLDSFMAETSSVTKMFRKSDPYGLMTTALISSRINWINNSTTLTPEQKAKAVNVLMVENSDFIQQHIPEFIDSLGDKAEPYITQMNEFIYGDSMIADRLVEDNETSNSKSGRGDALNASNLAKGLLEKLSQASGGSSNIGPKKYNYNYIPVKMDGAKLLKAIGGIGYGGAQGGSNGVNREGYTPHADFSVGKDVNRNVKGPKTQKISTSKQLSDLNKKTSKALEAEN